MHIYIMTDMEGVAGVLNSRDWCGFKSPNWERGREFLAHEVNAAIKGFLAAGATRFTIQDGHGQAINQSLLNPVAEYICGNYGWPLFLDTVKPDFLAFVGQHAKAGAVYAHLAHTQGFGVRDDSVNDVSIGEYGELVLCASELGIRVIFGAGDEAFAKEAQALTPGVETVAVKRGTQSDPGHSLTNEAYAIHNTMAIHLHPEEARRRIETGAKKALERARKDSSFGLLTLAPPFRRVVVYRADATQGAFVMRAGHPSSVIVALRTDGPNIPLGIDPAMCCKGENNRKCG